MKRTTLYVSDLEGDERNAFLQAIEADTKYSFEQIVDNDPILIEDSYFKKYAEEVAYDTGAVSEGWPCNCIDWDEAADELQMDYISFAVDGAVYWFLAF